MKVYGYTRVSTDEQARGGVSLEMQAERIRSYAASQGWRLVRIFEDAGHSGTTLERPGLQKMLSRLDGIGAVLVWKVDRISRKQRHIMALLEEYFEPRGVGFKSISEAFDTTSPMGRAMLGMLGVFAQLERDMISRRTSEALQHKLARGGHVGAPAFGFQSQVGMGVPVPPPKLKVGDYLQQWLDAMTSHVRPTTLRIYRYAVEHYIAPHLGQLPLLRLTAPAIEEWLGRMHKQELSPATVHQSQRVLRETLGQAVRWGTLPRSPMAVVRVSRVPSREMHVWDEEQVRLFLAEAKRSSAHYALYLMAILTGMRQGELLGLRWKDIDWTFERASIRQTLVRFRRDVGFKEPKSRRSRRTIALPAVLLEELRGAQDVQAGYQRALGRAYAGHDLVFASRTAIRCTGTTSPSGTFDKSSNERRFLIFDSMICGTAARHYCSGRGSTRRWSRNVSVTVGSP